MPKTHSVKKCKTARQFSKAVRKQGGYVTQGKGHPMMHHPDGGKVPSVRHRGDIATPTRCRMITQLLALGFLIFICVLPGLLLILVGTA